MNLRFAVIGFLAQLLCAASTLAQGRGTAPVTERVSGGGSVELVAVQSSGVTSTPAQHDNESTTEIRSALAKDLKDPINQDPARKLKADFAVLLQKVEGTEWKRVADAQAAIRAVLNAVPSGTLSETVPSIRKNLNADAGLRRFGESLPFAPRVREAYRTALTRVHGAL
jgi:hypothetical protein